MSGRGEHRAAVVAGDQRHAEGEFEIVDQRERRRLLDGQGQRRLAQRTVRLDRIEQLEVLHAQLGHRPRQGGPRCLRLPGGIARR